MSVSLQAAAAANADALENSDDTTASQLTPQGSEHSFDLPSEAQLQALNGNAKVTDSCLPDHLHVPVDMLQNVPGGGAWTKEAARAALQGSGRYQFSSDDAAEDAADTGTVLVNGHFEVVVNGPAAEVFHSSLEVAQGVVESEQSLNESFSKWPLPVDVDTKNLEAAEVPLTEEVPRTAEVARTASEILLEIAYSAEVFVMCVFSAADRHAIERGKVESVKLSLQGSSPM